ncbi:MAG: TonB-dependent receptor, partial [Kordiimonadaceae bacterium]|nr:TonB-dependent receptor [Kordiimonadaceae bacterium]
MSGRIKKMQEKNLYQHLLSGVALLGIATGLSGAAIAQDGGAADASAENEEFGIIDTIVTTRKRAESMQKVPVSVTAMTSEDLKFYSIQDYGDLQYSVPNLSIHPQPDSTSSGKTTIRGMTTETLITFDPSVGVYLDGVYLARTQGNLTNLMDVERVEVLKGPQGTLYGRNTTGGAIKVITAKPTEEFGGSVKLVGGSYDRKDLTAVVNMPLVEDLLMLRVAIQDTNRDGWAKTTFTPTSNPLDPANPFRGEDLNNDNSTSWRVSLRYVPDDATEVLFVYDQYKQRENAFLMKPKGFVPFNPATGAGPASLIIGVFGGRDPSDFTGGSIYEGESDVDSRSDLDLLGFTGTITHDFEAMTLKFIGAYRETERDSTFDLDGTPFGLLNPSFPTTQNQFTAELNLSGTAASDKLEWLLGAYYFKEKGDDGSTTTALVPINPFNPNITEGSHAENQSAAVFAHGTYALSENLSLTAGLRYTDERKELVSQNRIGNDVCVLDPVVLDNPGVCEASFGKDFSFLSWTFGADYQLSDNVLSYAKISRANRSGGFNLRGRTALAFEPFNEETATAYEFGLKSDLWERRIRANMALFYTDYKDIQLSSLVPTPEGGVVTTVRNAASAEIYGGEFELTILPTANLQINAGVGITIDNYLDFEV